MPIQQYLLLSLVDHQLASPDPARYLNVAGRWATQGTADSPLLVWPLTEVDSAKAAAERATRTRGRPVEVVSRGQSGWQEGGNVRLFTDASESALHGYAPLSEARTRRLRVEAEKLEAFCFVVRAASAASDHDAFAEVSRAASKALRTRFGGGSITSAFAWLAGRAGQEALESVLAGEVGLTGPLSLQQIVEAATLAQEAERLQQKG